MKPIVDYAGGHANVNVSHAENYVGHVEDDDGGRDKNDGDSDITMNGLPVASRCSPATLLNVVSWSPWPHNLWPLVASRHRLTAPTPVSFTMQRPPLASR